MHNLTLQIGYMLLCILCYSLRCFDLGAVVAVHCGLNAPSDPPSRRTATCLPPPYQDRELWEHTAYIMQLCAILCRARVIGILGREKIEVCL